jgi:PAS domain S-box-containing protein
MTTRKVVEVESYYEPMQTWFSVKVYPSHDGLTIFYTDVTERVKFNEEIIKERNLSDSIINSLPGIFYLYNETGKFLRWNKNFETVTEYSAGEISKMHPLDFFDIADKELLAEKIANTFLEGEDNVQADLLKKAKKKTPYYFTGKAIEYGGSPCLLGVGIDFTDRIKAQEKIRETTEQLRMLTAHLQHIREEERKRIGREIHDELGQQLTAIKMDVAWLDKKMAEEETVFKSKLKNIIELLDGSNRSIRRILSELRPGILDDYGLLEALEWVGNQFTANTGIPLVFTTAETVFKSSAPVVTCIFRVYQEALTNITRYAKATKVLTSLSIEDGIICVEIEDNGTGFTPGLVQTHKSFGLLGMKERVLSLGGSFELNSSVGNGTKITIKLPANIPHKYLT